MKKFNTSLLDVRFEYGYSLDEVAYLLGHRDSSTLSRYESGVRIPSLKNALKLELIYHHTAASLFYDVVLQARSEVDAARRRVVAAPRKERR